jgi:hypothetical protein
MRVLAAASRIDEIQAAVLRLKVPRLTAQNWRHSAIAHAYIEALAEPAAHGSHASRECSRVEAKASVRTVVSRGCAGSGHGDGD